MDVLNKVELACMCQERIENSACVLISVHAFCKKD
jgi:hypothetical protein